MNRQSKVSANGKPANFHPRKVVSGFGKFGVGIIRSQLDGRSKRASTRKHSAFQQFSSRKENIDVNRSQMPFQPCRRRRHVEPRLVAERAEARTSEPAFLQVQSNGAGL